MKLTKSQLKQLIREELKALNEATDPERIFKKYPKVLEYIEALINTPKEFVQLLNIIIDRASVKDQQKVLALRKLVGVLQQTGARPEGPAPEETEGPGLEALKPSTGSPKQGA